MKLRTITALFFVVVVIGALLLGPYIFTAFFFLLSVACLYEFYRMVAGRADGPDQLLGILLGGLTFGLFAGYQLGWFGMDLLLLTIPFTAAIFIAALYRKQEQPFAGIGYTLLGIAYVIFPFISFFSLGFLGDQYDFRLPLGFILILWGNDTGAYLVGKFFGKHRLFERISPNKTWEGLFGGIMLAIVTSQVLAHYYPMLAPLQWACIALVVSLFGTYGDLIESMLKRSRNVKDSGAVLPGHGGLLDRFDGLLLAAPAVLALLKLVF